MTIAPSGGWAAKIADLEKALADSRAEIEYDDYREKMRPTDETLKALAYAKDQYALELAGVSGDGDTRQSFAMFGKD